MPNISKMIKAIQKEVFDKERKDQELHWALVAIFSELGIDGFDCDGVEIDWRQVMGDEKWDNGGTDEQRIFAQQQAVKRLERVCKELKKLGFKCKATGLHGKANGSGDMWFQTPFITIDLS